MISIISNDRFKVTFEKSDMAESWFNNDCSDDNLKKQCNRTEPIKRIQFDDGKYIASLLHVYFNPPQDGTKNNGENGTKD